MARKPVMKQGEQLGLWTLRRFISQGGNGEVWEVENEAREARALKVLHSLDGDRYPRFRREVEIVQELDDSVRSVLPVVDAHLPAVPSSDDRPWFVMPLATKLGDALRGATVAEKVEAARQIADTLATLASDHGLNHRDIKPANLFFYGGRFVVGDFGVAKRPDDPDLTAEGRIVGPFHYLPSEVFVRDPDEVNWEKVDVACLGRSLWQLITEEDWVPRGPIEAGGEYRLGRYIARDYIGELDGLIAAATDESPGSRPTLASFARQLTNWRAGHEIRDEILREAERIRTNANAVLRWLVSLLRREPFFGVVRYDVDPTAPSEIPGLTEGDVGEALKELSERYLIEATPHPTMGLSYSRTWTRIFPTNYGIQQVESEDVLLAEAAPLLREFLTHCDVLSLPGTTDAVAIGSTSMTPANAFFLLRFLLGRDLIDFKEGNEGGSGVTVFNIRTTPNGRDWLVSRYAANG